jgi:hypothetical protein
MEFLIDLDRLMSIRDRFLEENEERCSYCGCLILTKEIDNYGVTTYIKVCSNDECTTLKEPCHGEVALQV